MRPSSIMTYATQNTQPMILSPNDPDPQDDPPKNDDGPCQTHTDCVDDGLAYLLLTLLRVAL